MQKNILAFAFAVAFSTALAAQTMPLEAPDPTPFLETIRADDLKNLLYVLASDSLEGRETGQPGQRKAAAFIARQFDEAGLPRIADQNSHQQKILLTSETWDKCALSVGKTDFKNNFNYYVYPSKTEDLNEFSIEKIVFMGWGIDDAKYSDYANSTADLTGKGILIYDGEPRKEDSTSLISGFRKGSIWSSKWEKKAEIARKKGAKVVFIIDPNIAGSIRANKKALSGFSMTPKMVGSQAALAPVFFISQEVAEALIGKKLKKIVAARKQIFASGKGQTTPVEWKKQVQMNLDKEIEAIEGSNVLGYIEGSDPVLKSEIVVVSAHYDHLGKRDGGKIFYGADDNASGSSTVIEICRAFAEAKKMGKGPRRSVVCVLVSGEEKGLLGSDYYTTFPIFPLKNTVCNVNIDMVGRIDDAHKNDPNYIYVIGSDRLSTDLHRINETVNERFTKLALDYKYNAPDDPNQFYYRSDHYNFAKNGIPAVFFFNGVHPDYHRTTDTPDKINFEKMEKIGRLAFATAWEIANRQARIVVDGDLEKSK